MDRTLCFMVVFGHIEEGLIITSTYVLEVDPNSFEEDVDLIDAFQCWNEPDCREVINRCLPERFHQIPIVHTAKIDGVVRFGVAGIGKS